MKKLLAVLALPIAILPAGCTTLDQVADSRIGQATLRTPTGIPMGRAELVARGDGVALTIVAAGLAPGARGFHIHTTGRCEGPDFTSAGGHLNPAGARHGTEAEGGAHLGDLPNLTIDENRSVTTTVDLTGTREAWLSHLFDGDGTALVIHENADDYRTDPTGNAGKRIACGVIERAS